MERHDFDSVSPVKERARLRLLLVIATDFTQAIAWSDIPGWGLLLYVNNLYRNVHSICSLLLPSYAALK